MDRELFFLCLLDNEIFPIGFGLSLNEDNSHLLGVIAFSSISPLKMELSRGFDKYVEVDLRKLLERMQLNQMWSLSIETREIRGVLCQIIIEEKSIQYLKKIEGPFTPQIKTFLLSHVESQPTIKIFFTYDETKKMWYYRDLKNETA